ncbi:MAG: cutinase family protein [Glaciihabitans sp.]|nr:cutinase family protein [Glaciihabitans sp.]
MILLRKSRLRLFAGSLAAFALVIGGVVGATTNTTATASAATTSAGGLFTALQTRALDTRYGTGGLPIAKLTGGHWYAIGIDGQGGIPTSNVSAVQVTFTVVNASAAGVLHADADGTTTPNTALPYATYLAGNTISNTAVIPVGADGKIQVGPTASTDLMIDVEGYFTGGNAAGGGYVPTNATQIYNSGSTQYPAGSYVTFPVAGLGGIPSSASSVMFDIIEANGGSTGGYLTPYPAGTAKPTTSLNWPAGRNYEWTTAVPLNSTGDITIYIGAGSGSVSLSVGVEGYFTASDGTTSAGEFTGAAARVFNSASPSAPIAAGASVTIPVAGIAGLPYMGAGIAAVAANVEISPGSGAQGHIQVFADDASPGQSAQQFYSGVSTFAFDVVSLGADGGVTIQNSSSGSINVIVDVEGWYQAPSLAKPTINCPAPYVDGYASSTVPSAPVVCTVSVSNGTYDSTNGSLDTYLDGVELPAQPFSSTTTTSQTVAVSTQGGMHSITSSADSSYGTAGTTASLGFTNPGPSTPTGFAADPWVTVPDPGNPDDPSATNFTPTLHATTNDSSPASTTFEIRSAKDTSSGSLVQTCVSPIVANSEAAACTTQPLSEGTYYVRSQASDATYTSAWSDWSTLPVSSIVNKEVLPPPVVSCPAITNGQWDQTPPTSTVTCQVTAAAAPDGSGSLDITLDGQGLAEVALSSTATTTVPVTVPAGAAGHDIETSVAEVTDGPATSSESFTFGAGDWVNANLVPNIANGTNSDDLAPALWVTTDGAPVTSNSTYLYTLATNSDGTGVIDSSLTAATYSVPSGMLTAGTTYYWQVQIQGPKNYNGVIESETSPWYSFVATADPNFASGMAAAGTQAQTIQSTAQSSSAAPIRCGTVDLLTLRGTNSDRGTISKSDKNIYINQNGYGTPSPGDGYGNNKDPEYRLVKTIRASTASPKIFTEAIAYPASGSWPKSVADGLVSLTAELNNLAATCPYTTVILSGHSQGAYIIDELTDSSSNFNKLKATAKNNLMGIALLGDPSYYSGEKIDAAGNGKSDGTFIWGLANRPKYSYDTSYSFRSYSTVTRRVDLDVRSWCTPYDEFCQECHRYERACVNANRGFIHNDSYGEPTDVNAEIKFLRQFIW